MCRILNRVVDANTEKSTFLVKFRKINLTLTQMCRILNITCVPYAQIGASSEGCFLNFNWQIFENKFDFHTDLWYTFNVNGSDNIKKIALLVKSAGNFLKIAKKTHFFENLT